MQNNSDEIERSKNMSDVFCINLGYVVAADEADKVEAVFRKHAAWMTDFYSEENDGPAHLILSLIHI